MTGADQKPEAISNDGPPHQRKMHKREESTVLLPKEDEQVRTGHCSVAWGLHPHSDRALEDG